MNFIKDTDCTVDTPVTYGKEERPVYGREVRFRPRVPGKRETATDKKNYLPRLLPLEDYDLIIVLFSGGKDSLAAYLKLLEWGVPKEKIELWHHDIDGGHPDRKMDWPVTQSYVEALDRIINGEQTYTLQEVPENSGHYKLVPDNVEVIQKGTPLSQSRLNRMTDGISFSHNVIGAVATEALRQAGLAHKNRQVDFEKRFLQGEATITGTPGGYFSTTYPFVLVPIPAGTEHITHLRVKNRRARKT